MKSSFLAVLICFFITCSSIAQQAEQEVKPAPAKTPAALNFKMKSIDGKQVSLSKYAGKVVLFVNVASRCGMTPHYEGLQTLHEKYGEKGLAIIGVPCNQFGKQEPGTDAEIANFCKEEYSVEFDMLSKVDVNGDKQCQLYKHLTGQDLKPAGKGPVKWNFEKIVLDSTGKPVARFGSRTKPSDKALVSVIEKALSSVDVMPAKSTGHYSHTSKKNGKTYYLFQNDVKLKNSDKTRPTYFFAKDKIHKTGKPLAQVPDGKMVSETKTGMLVLKNKEKN